MSYKKTKDWLVSSFVLQCKTKKIPEIVCADCIKEFKGICKKTEELTKKISLGIIIGMFILMILIIKNGASFMGTGWNIFMYVIAYGGMCYGLVGWVKIERRINDAYKFCILFDAMKKRGYHKFDF